MSFSFQTYFSTALIHEGAKRLHFRLWHQSRRHGILFEFKRYYILFNTTENLNKILWQLRTLYI